MLEISSALQNELQMLHVTSFIAASRAARLTANLLTVARRLTSRAVIQVLAMS